MLAAHPTQCSQTVEGDVEAVKELRAEHTAGETQMKRGKPSTRCFDIPVQPGTLTSEKVSNYTHCKDIDIREQGISDIEDGSLAALINAEVLEINFNDLETIRRGMWKGLKRLTELNLYKNNIVNVESHVFAEIPELSRLVLSGNQISEIRSDFWEDNNKISDLSMYNNTIRNLVPGVFKKLKHLRSLDLSGNLLTDIESGTFEGLGLFYLRLDRNKLTELRADMWQGLDPNMLFLLTVENNSIHKIESQCFSALHELGTLYLSSNPLGQISADIFDQTKLRFLYLISTGLTKLNQGTFLGSLSRLEDLRLDDNDLELTPDIFQGLTDLWVLHLENCKISQIQPEFWNGLESLGAIYLGKNRIESIGSGAFNNLRKLYKLDMVSNEIKELRPRALSGLKNLKVVNLEYNDLRTLDQNIFDPHDFPETDGHPSRLHLRLAGNPIQCDGALSWMIGQDWLDPYSMMQVNCADHPDMTLYTYLQCYTC